MRLLIVAVTMALILGLSGCRQKAGVDITPLENRVATLEKKLEDLESKVSALEGKIAELEKVAEKKVVKPKVVKKKAKQTPPPKEKGR